MRGGAVSRTAGRQAARRRLAAAMGWWGRHDGRAHHAGAQLILRILELDRRDGDGIGVSLLWHKALNMILVELVDERTGEELAFVVSPDRALDAFNHPYVYAARQGLLAAEAPREPVYA